MTTARKRHSFLGLVVIATLALTLTAGTSGDAASPDDTVTTPSQSAAAPAYRWQRTVLIASGQTERAWQFAVGVTEYVNQTYPDITVEVYAEYLGQRGKIHWFVDYESLAQLESLQARIAGDSTYNQMLADIEGTFVVGRSHDTMYRRVR